MPNYTVTNNIDALLKSTSNAAARTNLGLGDAATKNTGTTAGTVAAGDDSRITGAVQTSGGTMTGKLTAAADNTIAKLSVGSRTTGSSPTTLADGDIWISNQGALSYRDSTGPTSRAVAATSLSNTFNQPQTIGSTANAGAVLTVSNSGTREVVTISNTATATSDAVVITNLGSGNSLVVNDETTPDSTRFAVANNGRVGIGVAPDAVVALAVDSTGIKFSDGTTQITAASGGGSGTVTSITAGTGLTGGTITTSGTVAADFGTTTGKVTEGGTTVLKAGDTMTGKLNLGNVASTAPVNLGANVNPTPVVNGDVWLNTSNQLTWRGNNGATYPAASTVAINSFTAAQGISASTAGAVLGVTQTTGAGAALVVTQNATGTGSGITVDLNNTSSTAAAVRITNQGTGPSLVVEDQASVDPSPFTVSNNGKVGVGVAPDAVAALSVDANGIKFSDGTVQITAGGGSAGVSSFSAGTTGLTPATGTTGAVTLAGTLGVANGGTGQTTANAALNALLPSQASQSGKVLSTDGTNTSWITAGGGGAATPTNRQVFLASGTWTKPTGAKTVYIRAVGHGYGGGAGSRSISGKGVFGGTGGASGTLSEIEYDASALPSSLTITVPASPTGGYASFFCNSVSAAPPATTSVTTKVQAGNKTYLASPSAVSGNGSVSFLNSSVAGGSVSGLNSNAGGGSNAAGATTAIGPSGGVGGQTSTSTSSAISSKLLFDSMFTVARNAATTQFTTPLNASLPSWSGALNGNGTSGGGGGANALNTAFAGSGGAGGGWAAPVTLTNVSTTTGSTTVTCASTTGLQPTMSLPDILPSTYGTNVVQVETITSSTAFTINFPAATTASGLTVVAGVGAGGGGGGGGCTQGSTPILITGITLTSGSTTVQCTSTRGILPGMTIFNNANIPGGTTVASLTSDQEFIISAAATGSETAGKLVIAGVGTLAGVATTSGSTTVSATSTLGLQWGQAILAGSAGAGLNPTTSGTTRLHHIAAVTSPTQFVVSANALSATSSQTGTVMNTVGFLSGASCTAASPIVTVSDTTPLSVGMLVQLGVRGSWTTTAGTGATLSASFSTTGAKFFGDGTIESPSGANSTGTAVTFSAPADVIASVSGQYFCTRAASGNNPLPETTGGPAATTGYSYARILSIDSPTQVTLDTNALYTLTDLTMMYAFAGGAGGRASAGGVEIITYF